MSDDLLTRLKHFEEDRKTVGDGYGAELIYRTIKRIKELEARLIVAEGYMSKSAAKRFRREQENAL
jgi:hypothetical protein